MKQATLKSLGRSILELLRAIINTYINHIEGWLGWELSNSDVTSDDLEKIDDELSYPVPKEGEDVLGI